MRKQKKIDIHNHILFDVDDGAKTINESLEMVRNAINQGVDTLVLTPHVFSRASLKSRDMHHINFQYLQNRIKEEKLDVALFLGAEIKYKSHIDIDYENYTFGSNNALLLEFSTTDLTPIEDIVYNLSRKGYQVVVAHAERYMDYLSVADYYKIKQAGGYIQVNASSIIGPESKLYKKLIKKLFKAELIDIISSDAHNDSDRPIDLETSYSYLEKKIDSDYLNKLFYQNAYDILYK